MADEEFDAYLLPTIEKAEELTEEAKIFIQEAGEQTALLNMERIVTFELTEAQRIKMLSLALVTVGVLELEEGL